jgi:hypothetical protein
MPEARSRRQKRASHPRARTVPQEVAPAPMEADPSFTPDIEPRDRNGTLAISLLGVVVVLLALLVIAIALSL